MAKQKNTAGKKSVKGVSIQVANRRIDELRKRAAAAPLVARTAREHLERPLDSGIRVNRMIEPGSNRSLSLLTI